MGFLRLPRFVRAVPEAGPTSPEPGDGGVDETLEAGDPGSDPSQAKVRDPGEVGLVVFVTPVRGASNVAGVAGVPGIAVACSPLLAPLAAGGSTAGVMLAAGDERKNAVPWAPASIDEEVEKARAW